MNSNDKPKINRFHIPELGLQQLSSVNRSNVSSNQKPVTSQNNESSQKSRFTLPNLNLFAIKQEPSAINEVTGQDESSIKESESLKIKTEDFAGVDNFTSNVDSSPPKNFENISQRYSNKNTDIVINQEISNNSHNKYKTKPSGRVNDFKSNQAPTIKGRENPQEDENSNRNVKKYPSIQYKQPKPTKMDEEIQKPAINSVIRTVNTKKDNPEPKMIQNENNITSNSRRGKGRLKNVRSQSERRKINTAVGRSGLPRRNHDNSFNALGKNIPRDPLRRLVKYTMDTIVQDINRQNRNFSEGDSVNIPDLEVNNIKNMAFNILHI